MIETPTYVLLTDVGKRTGASCSELQIRFILLDVGNNMLTVPSVCEASCADWLQPLVCCCVCNHLRVINIDFPSLGSHGHNDYYPRVDEFMCCHVR